VVLDAGELETAARSGLIQPLDDILSPAEMADRFLFSIGLGTVDEQTLGFVVGADMQHLAYRPDRFESPPVSWTEIISPPVPFLFPVGTRSQSVSDATLIQYLAAGGKLTGEDGGPWLDESVMVSVLGFYSACVSTGTISPTVVFRTRDAGQAWEQFQNGEGEIAVVPASRFWLEADETVAAAAIPTQSGQPLSIAQGWALGMVTDDPVRQSLAVLLLDWLIAPDHNGQWTQAAGYLPGTQGALRIWDVSNAGRAVLRSLMEAAVPPPRPEVIAVVGPAMQEAVDSVLRGWATPEEAAAAAVKRLEE
jgi:ABC-type glycerol-3-phosphate transport system substrate-binding protein